MIADIILVVIGVLSRAGAIGMLSIGVIPKQIHEVKVYEGLDVVRKGLLIGTLLFILEVSMLFLMGGMYLFNPKPVQVHFLLYAFVLTSVGDLITASLLFAIYNFPRKFDKQR